MAVAAGAALRRPAALFVYGTLRRDARGGRHPLLRRARFVGAASMSGSLYDLGTYPGVVRDSRRGRVFGELYELSADTARQALRALDRYEGRGFVRQRVRVATAEGRRRVAWTYLLRARPHRSARQLESGRYPRTRE